MYGYYSGKTTHSETAYNLEGKRVAKILTNPCHAWAHQSQTFGQNSFGNLYFDGAAIYSYGSHFLAGFRIMPDGDRHGGVALLTLEKASVTTSGHMSSVAGSCGFLPRYYIPELTELRNILQSDPAKLEDFQRNGISNHVKRHIADYSDESAIYMLDYAGFHSAPKLVAKWRKELADKQAAEIKRDIKRELASAVFMAKETIKLFKERIRLESFIAECITECIKDNSGKSYKLESQIKKARHAHKHLPKKTHGKLKAAMWDLIKILVATQKEGAAKNEKHRAHKFFSDKVNSYRTFAERRTNDQPFGSTAWNEWHNDAKWLRAFLKKYRPISGKAARVTLADNIGKIELAYNEAIAIELAEREARQIRERAERFAREAQKRNDWLAGLSGYWNGTDEAGGALLRVNGEWLETSQGARVPLEHAIRAFPMIKLCKERGKSWQRNGARLPVGTYQVDAIYPNGDFKAGCHLIRWPEVERIARQLGVFEAPAHDTTDHGVEHA